MKALSKPLASLPADSSDTAWTILVAFGTAIGTVLAQRWIALRTQKATVLSANRVRWIEEFRKDTATFCELAHHVAFQRLRLKEAEAAADKDPENQRRRTREDEHRREVREKNQQLNTVYYHLILRLNTTVRRRYWLPGRMIEQEERFEAKKKLLAKFEEVESFFDNLEDYNDDIYRDVLRKTDELIGMVRDFLSREWLKVERLE